MNDEIESGNEDIEYDPSMDDNHVHITKIDVGDSPYIDPPYC